MSKSKSLHLPIKDVKQYEAFENIQYLTGYPRQYRFDAKKGVFNMKDSEALTKAGQDFTIVPIAYRIFTDSIIESYYGRRKWAEFFFINDKGQMCAILLHGHSVDNLRKLRAQLYYEGASLTQVALTIKPEAKKHDKGKYYIADFSIEVLTIPEIETHQAVADSLPPIYREDTYTGDAEMIDQSNYNVPISLCQIATEQSGDVEEKVIEQISEKEADLVPA